jgi:hypothetical protein
MNITSALSGPGALTLFSQQLQELKSRVVNAPAPRMPELPPPSPASQANRDLGRSVDVKL